MSKEEIKLTEHYWTSEYDILEDKGNGYIVVKLHELFNYEQDSFPHRHMEGCNIFLVTKPKQR